MSRSHYARTWHRLLFSDQGSILYNLLVGLLEKSVVPVSFLERDVSLHELILDNWQFDFLAFLSLLVSSSLTTLRLSYLLWFIHFISHNYYSTKETRKFYTGFEHKE